MDIRVQKRNLQHSSIVELPALRKPGRSAAVGARHQAASGLPFFRPKMRTVPCRLTAFFLASPHPGYYTGPLCSLNDGQAMACHGI
jgi:hypothetical protein